MNRHQKRIINFRSEIISVAHILQDFWHSDKGRMMLTEKRIARFWAKLVHVNEIEYEPIAEEDKIKR